MYPRFRSFAYRLSTYFNNQNTHERHSFLKATRIFLSIPAIIIFGYALLIIMNGSKVNASQQGLVTLNGYVRYSSGAPMPAGVTVNLEKTVDDVTPSVVTTESTSTSTGGYYSFQVEARCSVGYKVWATSTEIIDGEALPPSGISGIGGCVGGTQIDIEIAAPHRITIDGYVKRSNGIPVSGLIMIIAREKYDFNPARTTTEATVTDGNGYYKISTWSRCNIYYDVRALNYSHSVGLSGCITSDTNFSDFTYDGINNSAANAGVSSCNARVGEPINVTNGNMYLQQTDFQLPGIGPAINITRTYNSASYRIGLFGRGWSTAYDESVSVYVGSVMQLDGADGRATYFNRISANTFAPMQADFRGQIVQNSDNTLTLTLKDGSIHQFSAAGKLIALTDRNNNQTLLNYDANNNLASVTDPAGRVFTTTTDANGRVLTVSDALGTIATYTYGANGELLLVAYADNSKFQFTYTSSPNLVLASVSDALGNVLESHTYDSLGRALTSERQGGVERVTLNYVSDTETDVTNALGQVTKYFFDKSKSRNVVTRVEGSCNCGSSQSQAWSYDNQLNITNKANALNQATSFTYDAQGNRLTETDASGTLNYTYNSFGQVLTATDQMGGATTNTYDARGNLLTSKNALNKTTTFTYDAQGHLLTVADPRGNTTLFTYDAGGNLTQKKDAANNITTFAYDARGRLTSMTNALGETTTYAYDAAGRVNRVTQPDNSFVSYTFDLAGRRIRSTDARNSVTAPTPTPTPTPTPALAANGKIAFVSNREGNDEIYVMNADGSNTQNRSNNPSSDAYPAWSPDGTKMAFTSNRNGSYRVFRMNADGSSQTQLTATTGASDYQPAWSPDGTKIAFFSNRDGQFEIYVMNADGTNQTRVTTNAAWDSRPTWSADGGQIAFRSDRDGNADVWVINADGSNPRNLTSGSTASDLAPAWSPDGGKIVFRSDRSGNADLWTMNASDGSATANLTNSPLVAEAQSVWSPDMTRIAFVATVNGASHVFTMSAAGGAAIDLSATATTATTGDTSPSWQPIPVAPTPTPTPSPTPTPTPQVGDTVYAYDAAYRPTSVTDAAGNVTTIGYDLMSNVTSRTDALGRTTNYEYDEFSRLIKIIYPAATSGAVRLTETIQYDAGGNVTRRTDTAGRATNYEYDALNRVKKVIDPALQATEYEYNARSQMTALVDAANQRYTYTYDGVGQVTGASRGGGSMSFTYDATGNRTSRTDYNGATTNYAYDVLNRLTLAAYQDGTSASYAYDPLSRLITATNASGAVGFAYNNRGLMSGATDVWGQQIGYTYDANGNRIGLNVGQSVYTTYRYDALNRLTQLADGAGAAFTFAYDAAGRQTARGMPNGVVSTYEYNGLDQLTRLTHARGATTIDDYQYQQNPAGQITQITDQQTGTHTYAYDTLNRLTGATHTNQPAESYAYDAVGNRTTSQRSASYTHQPFNKLTNTASATYVYDQNGNLTSKTEGGATTTYTWDGENRLTSVTPPNAAAVFNKYDALGRRIERATSNGAVWTRYVYDGANIVVNLRSDGNVTEHLNGNGIDELLKQKLSPTSEQYLLTDHLGSTTALTDTSGNVIERMSYDSFGNSAASGRTRYLFTGREYDGGAGLYYYRARWYDPQVGRFISQDPIGFNGGDVNLYGYVWNSPLNFTDPMGLDGWGNDTADWLDERLGVAQDFYGFDPVISYSPIFGQQTFFGALYGTADLMRVGSGVGHALYDDDDNNYGRAANVAIDIARASGLFTLLGGSATRFSGGGRASAAESCPSANNVANGVRLRRSLASSQQVNEVGQPMAGAGTNIAFRDAPRIANQYGGNPNNWTKMRSSNYTSPELGNYGMQQFETHWAENIITGRRVEFKTKFPRLDR